MYRYCLLYTSYSILRFLLDSQYDDPSQGVFTSVEDIPVAKCREFILKYVVKGKHLKASIGYRNMDYIISDPKQDGGTVFECLGAVSYTHLNCVTR